MYCRAEHGLQAEKGWLQNLGDIHSIGYQSEVGLAASMGWEMDVTEKGRQADVQIYLGLQQAHRPVGCP